MKRYITAWIFKGKCTSNARLDGKTVVITGCNTGLGKETVREFYKRGARVAMVCRTKEKAEQAAEDIRKSTESEANSKVGEMVVYEMELGSLESVKQCAKNILETEQQINLLVNNAGIMTCPKMLSLDGFELQFATNHLGHFLFTLLLLPRILKSTPARIVILASSAHIMGDGKMHFEDINLDNYYAPWAAYGRSKTANILFAGELARKLEGTGVNTYAVHPGVIITELGRYREKTHPWSSWIMRNLSKPFLKTITQGIQTTLYCSLEEKCANETGLYYADCCVCTPLPRATNKEVAKQLWEESLKMVKLDENYDPFIPA